MTLSAAEKVPVATVSSAATAGSDLAVVVDGEALGERSSSGTQTSARAAIHLRASARARGVPVAACLVASLDVICGFVGCVVEIVGGVSGVEGRSWP